MTCQSSAPSTNITVTVMFALVVASGLAAPAFGIALASVPITPLAADVYHYIIRATSGAVAAILIIRSTIHRSGGINIPRGGGIFLVFYVIYIFICSIHYTNHGMVYLDPVKFWIFVGPVVLLTILSIFQIDEVDIGYAGLLVGYIIGALVSILFIHFYFSGTANIRRINSSDSEGNVLIVGYLASYCIAIWAALISDNGIFNRKMAMSVPFVAMSGYILFISHSRGPILAAIIPLLMILTFGKFGAGTVSSWFLRGLIFITVILAAFFFFESDFSARFLATADRISSGDEDRVYIWRTIWDVSIDKIFGYGIEAPFYYHPHNIFIEILMNMGLFGLSMFALVILLSLVSALLSLKIRKMSWIGAIFLAVISGAQFSSTLYLNTSTWAALALTFSIFPFIRADQSGKAYSA